jgi:hypothetical protein
MIYFIIIDTIIMACLFYYLQKNLIKQVVKHDIKNSKVSSKVVIICNYVWTEGVDVFDS